MNQYCFSDMRLGLSHSFQVTVTGEMMDAFRNISGDYNPLHVDRGFAESYGYPRQVVYGMLTASFYSRLVGMHLPGKFALFQGADIAFTAPVFPGDTLTVSGEVVSVHEAFRLIELKARITNQEGKTVSRAKLRAGINE